MESGIGMLRCGLIDFTLFRADKTGVLVHIFINLVRVRSRWRVVRAICSCKSG